MHLSMHPSICPSIHVSTLTIHPPRFAPINGFIHLSVHTCIHQYILQCNHPSMYSSTHLVNHCDKPCT
jgi:hypothetical protein